MDDTTGDAASSKACTGCGIFKPLTEFTFDKRHADGRQSRCKTCFNAYKKRYREADREHYLELRRQEYERLRPAIFAFQAKYRNANRERLRREARDRLAAMSPEDLAGLRQRHRVASAAYLARNPEVCAERVRTWRRRNPDKASDIVNRRRARKLGNGTHEKFTRTEIGDRDGWICGICLGPVDKTLRFPDRMSPSLDHIIPLVYHGEHTRANSRIAHWICNVRRGADRRRAPKAA